MKESLTSTVLYTSVKKWCYGKTLLYVVVFFF